MASLPKKRKKISAPPPHRGKTLDHFFAKKSDLPDNKNADSPKFDGLTDEEYARKLSKEWETEDQSVIAAGLKRRRSSPDLLLQKPLEAADGNSRSTVPGAGDTDPPPTQKEGKSEEILKTIESIPLDIDPLSFHPDDYQDLPQNWPAGRATYGLLVKAFVLVNSTKSRIKIVDTLVNLLRMLIFLDPESLLPAVWLTTNDIGPPYENNELGIGSSIITKAITKTSGITAAALKKLYHKHGDAGDVAFDAKSKQKTLMMHRPTPLTIQSVYNTLTKIAATSGKGSQDVKESHVKRLLVDAKGEEIRYLTRTFIQHLRIGAVKTTILIALARAFTLSRPPNASWECPEIPATKETRQELFSKAEEVLKQCFARRPNYNDLVPTLLHGGVAALEHECGMALHVPLKPMLGSITRDLDEMLDKLQGRDFTCEYKYDGQRAQIHCDASGHVSIFSRHLELMTEKYPDLVALVPKIRGEGVESFILEGEVVAVDDSTGELKPFQTLAGRERKNVDLGTISIKVCLFAFDLMYMNGQELLSRPLRERRELLLTKFTSIHQTFTWVQSLDATSSNAISIREFFKSALTSRCEGIMVKVLDNITDPQKPTRRGKPLLATYEPDKRLESWLKVKKDYSLTTSETLDLIPIGGWHGSGRKSAWWSPILLAVRNPNTGALEAVCKCMSGFTDKYYAEMKVFYAEDGENTSRVRKGYVESVLTPTVWFEPREVWEVAFADITLSPTYKAAAGLVSEERGLSLRFPRFVRRRVDKSVEEASTAEFLADLYWKQGHGQGADGDYRVKHEEEREVEEEMDEAVEDSTEAESNELGEGGEAAEDLDGESFAT